MPERSRIGRGPLVAGGSLLAVLIAAGGVYTASASTGTAASADYRTATVSRGPVNQVLTLTGTAQRVDQVTAAFPTSGTVTGISVKVGDHVSAGQSLATIDPTALHASLLAARAALAQDQASLIADETAPTSSATSATSAGSGGTGASASGSGSASQSGAGSGSRTSSGLRAAAGGSAGATGGTGGTGSTGGASTGGGSTGTGHSGGSAPTAGGHAAGGSGLPKLSTSAMQRAVAEAQQALLAEEQACAPVLGTPSSSGTSHHRPSTGTTGTMGRTGPSSSPRVNPAAFTPQTTPGPAATGTATPTTGVPSGTATVPPTGTPTVPPTGTPTVPPTGTPTVPPTGTPTDTPNPTGSPTSPAPGHGSTTPSADQLRTCATAMASASRTQHAAETALTGLATQIAHELTVIMQAATATSSGSSSSAHPSGSSAASSAASSAGSSGGATSSAASSAGVATSATRSTGGSGSAAGGGSSSATRVAADEVAILQDQDAVTQAQGDLEGATLKAPIAGTVGRIDLTVGQAASTSTGIVIVGAGAADVTVNVPLADMGLVHAGLATEVTPAGDVTAVPGTVSSVSLLPSSSTATTPTYPATIVVPAPPRSMASGSVASVAITVGQAADAVRVPVSALAGVQSGTGQVQVLTGSGTTTRAVTIGAVGSGFAQVMTGLAVGDRVVLADVNAALPSNQSNGLRGLGGGGFGGRGGGAGAAPGGRPGG